MLTIEDLSQTPVEVIVILVALSSTSTFNPFNNWVFVTVDGETFPTFAVNEKFGPRSEPNCEDFR
jgi:hypothetical protein